MVRLLLISSTAAWFCMMAATRWGAGSRAVVIYRWWTRPTAPLGSARTTSRMAAGISAENGPAKVVTVSAVPIAIETADRAPIS